MYKFTRSDWRFLFHTLALSLLALALLQAYGPYFFPDPQAPKIKEFIHDIVPIRPSEVPPMLQRADHKPVMLVIYASWCPYCRETLPDIDRMIRGHQLDHLKPVFLSIDKDAGKLAAYIIHQNYQTLFTPYRVNSALADGLARALQKAGSQFDGGIPYVGFFDGQGKLVAEYIGRVDKDVLLETANQLK